MYTPSPVPSNANDLHNFLQRELTEIQKAEIAPKDFLEVRVLSAPPQRFRAGMVVYADGIHFNPGSGEGLYRRDAANANWVFLG